MNYVYYMNSNSNFWIHLMLIPNDSTFDVLTRSSQTKPCLICIMCLSHYLWCPSPYAYKYLDVSCKHHTLLQIIINVLYIICSTSKMPMRSMEHQDAFVWVVYLVGEMDERRKALFANLERGVGIFLQNCHSSFLSLGYKSDNLYCRMAGTPSSTTLFF